MIDNPIINSPFEMPSRYFEIVDGDYKAPLPGRRPSDNLMPIPQPKKRVKQASFISDKAIPNEYINRVRERVEVWRRGRYEGVTRTTRQLLEYWTDPTRENKLFWCQIEALETVIFMTEVAAKREAVDRALVQELRTANKEMNPTLLRMAFKMATGAGKTVVMAMLIAWQALNKLNDKRNSRYSDMFLIVTPGLTIRDRLQVLQPNHPNNYYKSRDILPPDLISRLQQATIEIINYHKLMRLSDPNSPSPLGQERLGKTADDYKETPAQMAARVCKPFGNKREIIILNDEAHHCYRPRENKDSDLDSDEKQALKEEAQRATVWLSGLEAIQAELGIKAIYDLSATPAFLKGSGYPEASIFPWIVSDFSLLDAIEAGIVKIPRLPVMDNAMNNEDMPMYRELWPHIKDDLPKKGRKDTNLTGIPKPPNKLEAALRQLYGNYKKVYDIWANNQAAQAAGQTAPVFIIVCNNTAVSKLVYDWVSGYEQIIDGAPRFVPGNLALFSNEQNGQRLTEPNTILVDSEQLESGEGMSAEFKQVAQVEIEAFKLEYRRRYPGADVEKISESELLREVMNTVGKKDMLGAKVRCVVSVSMLTEGWDANTVTHIMGVRAFSTQLLCEQVVGRALRRISYATEPDAEGRQMFTPEYADVLGVPFRVLMPSHDKHSKHVTRFVTHVQALTDRKRFEINFPRATGYHYEHPRTPLTADFSQVPKFFVTTKNLPTETLNEPIFGQGVMLDLEGLKQRREAEIDFLLAKLILEKYFRLDEPKPISPNDSREFQPEFQTWRFPEILAIVKHWRTPNVGVAYTDDTFPQLLLLLENAHIAADRVYSGIRTTGSNTKIVKPIMRQYDPIGTTAEVDFDTVKATVLTTKSHVNRVTLDSGWEGVLTQKLESMDEVICYVKNERLGFEIPYTLGFKERNYIPDFIVKVMKDGQPLNLIIEVSGERRLDKEAKIATIRHLWLPAINGLGSYGTWDFIEINGEDELRTAKEELRNYLKYGETRRMLIAEFDDEAEVRATNS